MKTRLTDKQYWYLSVIAYLDVPQNNKDVFIKGTTTLHEMARIWIDDIMRNWVFSTVTQTYHPPYFNPASIDPSCITREEWVLILLDIYDDPFSKDVIFYNFVHQDTAGANGLCFYDFLYPNSSRIISFRGSKLNSGDIAKEKDWQDNFYMALFESNQYNDISEYLSNIKYDCTIYVTGHSKGGNNALYCCSTDERVTGCMFDAPGFGAALTKKQCCLIESSGAVNFVCCEDWIGAILAHPEKRVFCKNKVEIDGLFDLIMGHIPQQFMFDQNGNIIEGERSERSIASEKFIDNAMDAVLGKRGIDEVLNENFDLMWPIYEKQYLAKVKIGAIKEIAPSAARAIIVPGIKRIIERTMKHKGEQTVYDLVCVLINEWGEKAYSFDESDSASTRAIPILNYIVKDRWIVDPSENNKKHYKFETYY